MKCAHCGTDSPSGMRYCGGCAAPLAPLGLEQTYARGRGPVVTPGVVSRFTTVDSSLADGERKLVTILFADIAGFTALAETTDPEALRELINACFARLVPCVERYGGTVDKFIGDEVMALFGAPRAHDNDAERALRAALDMRHALLDFNRTRGTSLAAHFGVNTGLVLAGSVGVGAGSSYSVMGDAVNVASRLAGEAGSGDILIGPDTHRLAGHLFECEEVGPARVRGRSEALRVFRVLAEKRGFAGTRPGGRRTESTLVGRETETQALLAAVSSARRGSGGVVSVVADPGLGKSRLIAEVRRLVASEVNWLEGRAVSFGSQLPYLPFIELVQTAADIDSDDAEAERYGKLERLARRLFAEEVLEVLPYLATFLALPIPGDLREKVRYLDGEAMGRQVYRAVRGLVVRLAHERATVLVFEDIHWLDDSSADLVGHLLSLVAEEPLLIVLVGRPDVASPLGHLREVARGTQGGRYHELTLAPLSGQEARRLARNLVGSAELPAGLWETIEHTTEGNPLFVEEVVGTLIDLGGLVPDERSGWRITEAALRITIPDTLQGVIMTRIDHLDDELKQVLRVASVLGRIFFYRVLAALADAGQALDGDLRALGELDLVRERARDPELEYIFKHALVQEATYGSILLERRKALHRRAAESIEELFPDRAEEFCSLLAYHYSRAEEWEKAQEYLFKAGDRAGQIAADTEALAHYRQALAAYAQVFGDRWDPAERAALELKMGEVLWRRGDHAQAIQQCRDALGHLGHALPTTLWGVRLAMGRALAVQVGHRLLQKRATLQPSVEEGALGQVVRLYVALIWMTVVSDQELFALVSLRLLNLAERRDLAAAVVPGASAIGTAADMLAHFGVAKTYHELALTAAEGLGHIDAIALAQQNRALHDFMHADFDDALHHGRRSADIYHRMGDLRGWGMSSYWVAYVACIRADHEAGIHLAGEMVIAGREGGDTQVQVWGLSLIGLALHDTGRTDDAITVLREGLGLAELIPDHVSTVACGATLGACHAKAGRPAEALRVLEEAEAFSKARKTRVGIVCVPLYVALAETHIWEFEHPDGGGSCVEPASAALRRAAAAVRKAVTFAKGFPPGLPAALRARGICQWLSDDQGRARTSWMKSLTEAERLGMRYQAALTHLELGRRAGDGSHVEAAEAAFTELGIEYGAARGSRVVSGFRLIR